MRRAAKWTAGGLLALLAALLLALGLLLDTTRGLALAARWAPRLSGGALSIGATQGRVLGGDFELRDFDYTGSDGSRIVIGRVRLRWRPGELLSLRLHLERLDVEALTVVSVAAAATAPAAPFRVPTQLPVDVVVEAASLRGFRLEQAGSAPFTLADVQFAGSWIGNRLDIVRLETSFPETGPLRVQAKAQLAADRIDIEALHLVGPGTLDAQGRLGFASQSGDLRLSFKGWRYPLTGDTPPLAGALQGQAHFSGAIEKFSYELQAEAVAQKQPLTLAAHGSGDARSLTVEALDLGFGKDAKAGRASAHGRVDWTPAFRADLDIALQKLDPGAILADWNGQLNGAAQVQTSLREGQPQIAFTLAIDHSRLRGQPLQVSARGTTDTRSLKLDALMLEAGRGHVDVQGSLAWSPALRANVDASLKQFDPSIFAPGWPGALNGRLRARSVDAPGAPRVAFEAQLADSRLRNYPLRLAARGEVQGETVQLAQFDLASGATQLKASGRVTPPFDAQAQFASPDLAALYPGASGALDFDFKLQGALADPHVLSRGRGTNLREGGIRIAQLDWNADVQPSRPSQIELTAADGFAGIAIPRVTLSATGVEQYHRLELKAQTERGDVSLVLQGGYDRKRAEWGGEWQSVRVAPQDLPAWSLEKPVGLLLGAQRFSLEPACFAAAENAGRACLNLVRSVTQPGLHASATLEAVALAGFQPLLPKEVKLAGRLDGQGALQWADGDVGQAQADFRLSQTRISAPNAPTLELEPSSLAIAQQADGSLHARLDLRSAQAQIGADLTAAPAADFAQRPLSGELRIAVPDIAFVTPYVSELATAGGHIDGDLRLAGTLGAPRLAGQVALADAHARLVTPGIELSEVGLKLSGDGTGPLRLQGSMRSGGGLLSIAGQFDPALQPLSADLHITGEDFLAVSIASGRAWITPDLHLLKDASGVHFDGTINVPKADITPKDLGDSGVSASRDQVLIVKGKPQVAVVSTPLKIYSTVKLALGKAVKFAGFGLTTRVEGAVTVHEEPLRDTTAQGELRLVDGAYKAYGQDLKIEDGRLIFDGGSVTQPALDISASRHPADDIKVGVRVRGTLKRPQLTLQSDPPMSREQQLSWLVLGRPLEQNSTQDRSAISSAALSLGLSGGDFLANRIGKKLGLDAISVGSAPAGGSDVAADATTITGSQAAQNAGNATTNAAALTLGKYLTPKLFVSYGVSLFQPGQTFRLLYSLGHGFKVQAESGVASGGDLLYTYERGRSK